MSMNSLLLIFALLSSPRLHGHRTHHARPSAPSSYDSLMHWVDSAYRDDSYVRATEHRRYREGGLHGKVDDLLPSYYWTPWVKNSGAG